MYSWDVGARKTADARAPCSVPYESFCSCLLLHFSVQAHRSVVVQLVVRPEKRPYYGQLVALDIDLCFLLSACRVLLSGYDRERVLVLVCFGLQYNEIICNVPEGMDVKLIEVSRSRAPVDLRLFRAERYTTPYSYHTVAWLCIVRSTAQKCIICKQPSC